MTLHENEKLFREAVLATAQEKIIPEIFIEKDYWVTLALKKIFHSRASDFAVFKGGTALSKCHQLIYRFSEDIDMAVISVASDNPSRLKSKLKVITESVCDIMPEIQLDGVTNKLGMIRKTAHQFPKLGLQGVYGQVRQDIIIEASWLGTFEPFIESTIVSYITAMMMSRGQQALVDEHGMNPFPVRVLSKERTFAEKIMSLARFSFSAEPNTDLASKIRHIYDLNMMLKNSEIEAFFSGQPFNEMLIAVGNDDVLSYKNANAWLINHPLKACIFSDPDNTWSKIRGSYSSFKDLVFGPLPTEKELTDTLKKISERLEKVEWAVTFS
jgi:predicted nucleotidyltransferase component of viral defense system